MERVTMRCKGKLKLLVLILTFTCTCAMEVPTPVHNCSPERIEVHDAGGAHANGIYVKQPLTYNNRPRWQQVANSISRDGVIQWDGRNWILGGNIIALYYKANGDASRPDVPPTHGWRFSGDMDSNPTLRYQGNWTGRQQVGGWWATTTEGQVTMSVLVLLGVGLLAGLAYTSYRMRKNAEGEPIEYDVENPAPLAEPIEIVIDPSVGASANQKMTVRVKHWRRIKKNEHIGKGSYGTVYESWSDDLGTTFATKEIELDDYLGGDEDMITERKNAIRKELLGRIKTELVLLRALKHPNILQHFGEEISISKKRLYIFTELMFGTIQDRLDEGAVIPNKLVARYGNDILAGLRYLHERNPLAVVHRDIKPANLLFNATGRIKLGDFGTVKILDRFNDDNSCRFPAGTYLFAPPEMHRPGTITPAFDVWSLGVTLHMMVTGRSPWPKQYTRRNPAFLMWLTKTLVNEGVKLDNPILLANPEADMLKDMILTMLAVRPEDRPTVAEIQEFPFFKNYDDTAPVTDTKSLIAIDKLTELQAKDGWRMTETQTFDECKWSDLDLSQDCTLVIEYGSTRELPPILNYGGGDDSNDNTHDDVYSADYDER